MRERFDAISLQTQIDQPGEQPDKSFSSLSLTSPDMDSSEPTPSADLRTWTDEQSAEVSASIRHEIDRGVPWKVIERRLPHEHRTGSRSEAGIALVVAETVGRRQLQALVEVALHRLGNPSLDQVAQLALPSARHEAQQIPTAQLGQMLDHYLGKPRCRPYATCGRIYRSPARSPRLGTSERADRTSSGGLGCA